MLSIRIALHQSEDIMTWMTTVREILGKTTTYSHIDYTALTAELLQRFALASFDGKQREHCCFFFHLCLFSLSTKRRFFTLNSIDNARQRKQRHVCLHLQRALYVCDWQLSVVVRQ
jgi:hypothetical protein